MVARHCLVPRAGSCDLKSPRLGVKSMRVSAGLHAQTPVNSK